MYYGVASEATGPSRAVDRDPGRDRHVRGRAGADVYFSSSGGRTISSLDAFGTDIPYLVAVDDKWDEVSPNFRWPSQVLTGAQLAKRFDSAAP